MKKLLVSVAAAAIASASPASAALFEVSAINAPVAVPGVNDFQSDLAGLGYTGELIGASVKIIGGGWVSFEFLGSESGFFDSLTLNGETLYSETSSGVINSFGAPTLLQSYLFNDGDVFNILFTNTAGASGRSATQGEQGFAVFVDSLNPLTGPYTTNQLVFGYDDQSSNAADDNHDDLIIRATISPVPEPATWAMMVGGIAAVGFAMRRRSQTARVSFS